MAGRDGAYVVASKVDAEEKSGAAARPGPQQDGSPPARASDKCNPLSRLLFYWIDPTIRRGYLKRLEPWETLESDAVRTAPLVDNFEAAWAKQLALPAPDLKKAIAAGNVSGLVFTGCLYAIAQACRRRGRRPHGLLAHADGAPYAVQR